MSFAQWCQGRSYPRESSIILPRVVKRPYSRLAIKPSIVRVLIIRAGLIMPIKIFYDRDFPRREFHLTEFSPSFFFPLLRVRTFSGYLFSRMDQKWLLYIHECNYIPSTLLYRNISFILQLALIMHVQ